MSGIIPFDFDGRAIRVMERAGEPWFVAGDVCDALTISNTGDALSRLDEDEKDDIAITDAIGRMQQTGVVSESGLYSLILTSRKPEAKRFKKWVTTEVLPSIRKTGQYRNPQRPQQAATVAALLAIGRAVSRVPGVKPELAMSVTLNLIERTTGLPATQMRLALPGGAPAEAVKLNATQIGERVGRNAREVNAALATLGFQAKTDRGNVVTEAGTKYGEMTPFTRHGHSGYQPLWYEGVIEPLNRHFGPGSNVVPMAAPRPA